MGNNAFRQQGASLGVLNAANTLYCEGFAGFSADVRGTFVGTITFEISFDAGTTWTAVNVLTGAYTTATATVTTATAAGLFVGNCAGAHSVRARMSAYTSGSATVNLKLTAEAPLVAAVIAGSPATTISSGTITTVSTVTTLSTLTGGNAAEDAATTANPLIAGGVVRSAATPPITFAAGDAVRHTMTSHGGLLVTPYSTPEAGWSYAAASGGVVNTTDVVLAAAAGASLRRYITSMTLSNSSATATEVVLKDGATIIWRGHCPASCPNIQVSFAVPLKTTANAALNFACITTAAAVYVNAQGFTAP